MSKSPLNQAEIFASDMLGTGVNADTLDGLDSLSFMRRDESTFPSQDGVFDLGNDQMRWKNIYVSGNIITGDNENITIAMLRNDDHLIPSENAVFDIGSTDMKWKKLYVESLEADNINNLNTDHFLTDNNHSSPVMTDAYNLGDSNYRWKTIYATGLDIEDTCILKSNGTTVFTLLDDGMQVHNANSFSTIRTNDDNQLALKCHTNGGGFRVHGLDDTGTHHTLIAANANDSVTLFEAGIWKARTRADGFEVDGIIYGEASSAQYADLAENYKCDISLPIGTVVQTNMDDDSEYTVEECNDINSPFVIGIVSENPAFLMNKDEDGLPIALTGKVRVRVLGKIQKGMPIISAENGCAREYVNNTDNIIGYAIESNDDINEKLVYCIVK